jgi:hypothetical protein
MQPSRFAADGTASGLLPPTEVRGFESFPGALPETLSAPVLISPQVAYFRYSSYRALPDLNYRGGAQKHSNIGTSIRMPDIRSK